MRTPFAEGAKMMLLQAFEQIFTTPMGWAGIALVCAAGFVTVWCMHRPVTTSLSWMAAIILVGLLGVMCVMRAADLPIEDQAVLKTANQLAIVFSLFLFFLVFCVASRIIPNRRPPPKMQE